MTTTYSLLSLKVPNLSQWRSALTRCNRGGWLLRYLAWLARPVVAEGGRLSGEGKELNLRCLERGWVCCSRIVRRGARE